MSSYSYKDHLAAKEAWSKGSAERSAGIRKNAGLRLSGKPTVELPPMPPRPKSWLAYTPGGDYMGWLPVEPWESKAEAVAYLKSEGLVGTVKLEP